jgi:hypothetical protein
VGWLKRIWTLMLDEVFTGLLVEAIVSTGRQVSKAFSSARLGLRRRDTEIISWRLTARWC